MARICRHTLSPEELQAAFARREAALSAAKAQASHDWTPEYVPPSIIPQRFKKGTLLKKAARVSAAMILKVILFALDQVQGFIMILGRLYYIRQAQVCMLQ